MTTRAEATSMAAGVRLGRYDVLSRLYSGDVSEIWTATPVEPAEGERLVALKTLRSRLSSHPPYRDQFAQEIALHAHVDHPSIVRCAGFGTAVDCLDYLALEYVEGTTLRELLDATGRGGLPIATALRLMARVCDALAYLHELAGPTGARGIVHCDVCPENILVESVESVKLIDLGSASPPRGLAPSETPIASRIAPRIGRLQYRAPERIQCTGLDGRSDVYSVGVILFELTHGAPPFHAESTQQLLHRICSGDVLDRAEPIDAEVAALVAEAMRVNPAERIPTARELGARALAAATRLDGGRVAPLPDASDAAPDTVRPAAGTALDQEVHDLLRAMRESDPRPVVVAVPSIEVRTTNGAAVAPAATPFDRASSHRPPQGAWISNTANVFAAHHRRHTPDDARPAPVETPPAADGPAKAAAGEFERGWKALRSGSAAEALQAWEEALALDPHNRIYALNVRQLRKKLLQCNRDGTKFPGLHAGGGPSSPAGECHEPRRST